MVNFYSAHDHIGKKFGMLEVLERVENDKHKKTMWLCKCECGKTTITRGQELIRGETTSCGCYRKLLSHMQIGYTTRTRNLEEGEKFGRLKVVSFEGFKKNKHIYKCLCDCGSQCCVSKRDLVSSRVKSCGCYQSQIASEKCRKNCLKPRKGICKLCSKVFSTVHGGQKFCCRKHSIKYHNDMKRNIENTLQK